MIRIDHSGRSAVGISPSRGAPGQIACDRLQSDEGLALGFLILGALAHVFHSGLNGQRDGAHQNKEDGGIDHQFKNGEPGFDAPSQQR